MSTPSFTVTKLAGTFVQPSGPTPPGSLPLSPKDITFLPGSFVEQLLVHRNGSPNAAEVVKQALSKALVPYYPLAGRLTRSENCKLSIDCTGDGVWFVEASAEYGLPEDIRDIPSPQLLSYPPNPAGSLLMFQVTQFTCGVSVIGLIYDHCVADGSGMAQFINGVAAIARGASMVDPIWCRDAIPGPPKPASKPPPPAALVPAGRNSYFHVDFSADQVSKIKAQLQEQTGHIRSSFDVLTAITWQARARAIDLELDDDDVNLAFAASTRRFICHALPGCGAGYYGNTVYPVVVTVALRKLIAASITEVVDMISDAKAGLADQVSKWSKGEESPFRPRFGYNSMFMASWLQLGFEEVDYGWGKPDYVPPVMDKLTSPVAFLVQPPTPKQGVRLISQCVMEEHLAAFQDEMVKAFQV